MICKGPLTPAQLASSQHNYHIFSLINGLSYMCLGETVLILGSPSGSAARITSFRRSGR